MSRPGGKRRDAVESDGPRTEITINISIPRPLHHRVSIACAALDLSLKAATNAALAAWVDANAEQVASDVAAAVRPVGHGA
jgi:hypothetical protein